MTTETQPKCLCGKPATHTAYLPSNVWAGIHQLNEPHWVCEYHANKANIRGYQIRLGIYKD